MYPSFDSARYGNHGLRASMHNPIMGRMGWDGITEKGLALERLMYF